MIATQIMAKTRQSQGQSGFFVAAGSVGSCITIGLDNEVTTRKTNSQN
jgi:hypothetical protein